MNITYPGLRTNVLAEIESLADTGYQQRAWVDGNYPPGTWDDLSVAVNVLLGDTPVCREPEEWVGVCLYLDEVEPLRAVGQMLAVMLDELGDADDEVYLSDPRWPSLVTAAGDALRTARENDANYADRPGSIDSSDA